jgi:hypothetical protein
MIVSPFTSIRMIASSLAPVRAATCIRRLREGLQGPLRSAMTSSSVQARSGSTGALRRAMRETG